MIIMVAARKEEESGQINLIVIFIPIRKCISSGSLQHTPFFCSLLLEFQGMRELTSRPRDWWQPPSSIQTSMSANIFNRLGALTWRHADQQSQKYLSPVRRQNIPTDYKILRWADRTGPIENAVKVKDSNYKCNAFLCRGYQYEDNKSNVKSLRVNDSLAFHIDLVAGHRPGFANFSVVSTKTNQVLKRLKTWDHWPDVTDGSTYEQKTNFNITIPPGLESTCKKAGSCVMQWYWYAINNEQTYESCHDFIVVNWYKLPSRQI
jgi:hypothetical protein